MTNYIVQSLTWVGILAGSGTIIGVAVRSYLRRRVISDDN